MIHFESSLLSKVRLSNAPLVVGCSKRRSITKRRSKSFWGGIILLLTSAPMSHQYLISERENVAVIH